MRSVPRRLRLSCSWLPWDERSLFERKGLQEKRFSMLETMMVC